MQIDREERRKRAEREKKRGKKVVIDRRGRDAKGRLGRE
jgi:hypothetical protein